MKRMLTIALLLISLIVPIMASEPMVLVNIQEPTAKDLYFDFKENTASTENNKPNDKKRRGRPGTKLQIELSRDNKISKKSTKDTFYSGDRVAFLLTSNFSGYVRVVNFGTTGKNTVLYDGKVDSKNYRIPQKGWIRFDNNEGTETVKFIFSSSPMKFQIATGSNNVSGSSSNNSTNSSTGGQVSGDSEEQILNEVNSKELSRDLVLDVVENETYVLTSVEKLPKPQFFTVKLAHK